MPLGHLGINVADLDAARSYYDRLMPVLDYEPFIVAVDEFAYRPAAGRKGTYLFFYLAAENGEVSPRRPGLQHLAFMVRTRQAVRDAYAVALEIGSESIATPRSYPQYPPPYYAAFWSDLNGLMLEVVCHHDRD